MNDERGRELAAAERFFDWRYARDFTLRELTTVESKAELYALEATYRETLYELACPCSDDAAIGETVRGAGLCLFRPDAIVHGKVAAAAGYLAELGFNLVGTAETEVCRSAIRDVWRYQLDVASGARLRLLDLLFGATPSLVAIYRLNSTAPRIPCSVLLADSKGLANGVNRQGWELRSFLGSPNRIEVYVHCSDEPADVVRDGGILLGPRKLRDLIMHPRPGLTEASLAEAAESLAIEGKVRTLVEEVDELLCPALGAGVSSDKGIDRWEVIRAAAARCGMIAATTETTISDSGTYEWWSRIGLLDSRAPYFADRTGWVGNLREPHP